MFGWNDGQRLCNVSSIVVRDETVSWWLTNSGSSGCGHRGPRRQAVRRLDSQLSRRAGVLLDLAWFAVFKVRSCVTVPGPGDESGQAAPE